MKDNFISANQQRTQVGNYNYQLTYSPAGRIGTKQCMHNGIDFVYGYNSINSGYCLNHEIGGISDGQTDETVRFRWDDDGNRLVPGKNSNGENVMIKYGNVHSGKSDKGNYNSRGSQACITIHPDDADAFSHISYGRIIRTQQALLKEEFLLTEM